MENVLMMLQIESKYAHTHTFIQLLSYPYYFPDVGRNRDSDDDFATI